MSLDRFLTKLRRAKPPINAVNPWRGRQRASKLRQANLATYFGEMEDLKPTVLLIGEAPGYRGCGLTGVPFTSERILVEGRAGLFGANSSYQICGNPHRPSSESSATIVWQALNQYSDNLPLIWNAYPFHPHKPGNLLSNRPPTGKELEIGATFLRNLIDLYPSINQVVAVGNRAAESLTRQQIEHYKIRHPSHGGKRDFVAGLEKIYA